MSMMIQKIIPFKYIHAFLTDEEIEIIDFWYRTKEINWPGRNKDEDDLYYKLTGKQFDWKAYDKI